MTMIWRKVLSVGFIVLWMQMAVEGVEQPRITDIKVLSSPTQVTVSGLGQAGRAYTMEWAEALDSNASWKKVGNTMAETNGTFSVLDETFCKPGFYRAIEEQDAPAASYLVVDISGGTNAANWPVSELMDVPSGGWGDEYKTTKIVLRRIPAGKFMMGSPSNELGRQSRETLHEVTLTKPFYIGVFEVTQKQWELVTGKTSLSSLSYPGDMRPVVDVNYYQHIRGYSLGKGWPDSDEVDSTSFMGLLRSRASGYRWDLPTEAQWEYACRAGTPTALNNGKDLTDTLHCANMDEVGRYSYNTSDGKGGYKGMHTTVGSYLPNSWGLYDMHGNVWEWCLDWDSILESDAVIDPMGAKTGTSRALRGGCYKEYARHCRSARRGTVPSMEAIYDQIGFRLACQAGQ